MTLLAAAPCYELLFVGRPVLVAVLGAGAISGRGGLRVLTSHADLASRLYKMEVTSKTAESLCFLMSRKQDLALEGSVTICHFYTIRPGWVLTEVLRRVLRFKNILRWPYSVVAASFVAIGARILVGCGGMGVRDEEVEPLTQQLRGRPVSLWTARQILLDPLEAKAKPQNMFFSFLNNSHSSFSL